MVRSPSGVQRITTIWTKRTRGAEGREARARLPDAYPLLDEALVARSPRVEHIIHRREVDYLRSVSVETSTADSAESLRGKRSAGH